MKLLLLLLLLAFVGAAFAQQELYQFDNPAQEKLYHSLVAELRCLVCQNQNLEESNADLAKDLRRKTWELVVSGASEEEVIEFMIERYGEFVLYRPPFKPSTLLLWVGPFLLLFGGAGFIALLIRRRAAPNELSESDRERVRELLDGRDETR